MSSDESKLNNEKANQSGYAGAVIDMSLIQTIEMINYLIKGFRLLSPQEIERFRRIDQRSMTLEVLKDVLENNEAFEDKEHFKRLVEGVFNYRKSRTKRVIDGTSFFLPVDKYLLNLYLVDDFVSKNANVLETRYNKYKELLSRSESEIDKIISVFDPTPPSRYKAAVTSNGETKVKEKICYDYLHEALRKYLPVKEKAFEEDEPLCELRLEFEIAMLIFILPCRKLASNLLQKEEIALKVARSVYPLDNVYEVNEGANVEDLPYIMCEISPNYKKQLEYFHCLEERFKETKEIIENAIKLGSLSAIGEGKGLVKYKDLATWLKERYEQNPAFPVPFPDWLKARIGIESNSDYEEVQSVIKKRFSNEIHSEMKTKEVAALIIKTCSPQKYERRTYHMFKISDDKEVEVSKNLLESIVVILRGDERAHPKRKFHKF